jgi:hypothetical protein
MPKITPHKFDANGTELKRCSKCPTWKVLDDFYKNKASWDGFRSDCKKCANLKFSIYREENRDRLAAKARDYTKKNKAKVKNTLRKYRDKNKEKRTAYIRKYREKNKEKINQQSNLYRKKRRKEDPQYRLTANMRAALYKSLKSAKLKKNNRTFRYVSCSPSFLLERLERQRIERGLSEYAVDHMTPLDSFDLSDPEELRRCWHFSNLQALSPEDNLRKGSKLIYDMEWARDEWVIRTKEGNGLYRPTALFRSVLVV